MCSVDTGGVPPGRRRGARSRTASTPPGRCAIDCALGGEDGRTLYLATADSYDPATTARTHAGRISAVRVPVPGPHVG
ncbi:hypothetical protein [Curtobacterium sp. MCPF17_052]|uniref:hypothetical protein n=1 Tax=Curtobacterium sp. MCPF17_052 TaxID=2175655 RepID=UPI003463E2E5